MRTIDWRYDEPPKDGTCILACWKFSDKYEASAVRYCEGGEWRDDPHDTMVIVKRDPEAWVYIYGPDGVRINND